MNWWWVVGAHFWMLETNKKKKKKDVVGHLADVKHLNSFFIEKGKIYIEKFFRQKLSKIKFPTKNSVDAYLYLHHERSWGAPKICHFLKKIPGLTDWYGHWHLGRKRLLKKIKKTRSVRPWCGHWRTESKIW